jgi:hypothetical protein
MEIHHSLYGNHRAKWATIFIATYSYVKFPEGMYTEWWDHIMGSSNTITHAGLTIKHVASMRFHVDLHYPNMVIVIYIYISTSTCIASALLDSYPQSEPWWNGHILYIQYIYMYSIYIQYICIYLMIIYIYNQIYSWIGFPNMEVFHLRGVGLSIPSRWKSWRSWGNVQLGAHPL